MNTVMCDTLAPSKLPRRLSIGVAGGFVLLALAPFPLVGETWGMEWFVITMPFSLLVHDFLPDPVLFVLVTTLLAAAVWAALVYFIARLIQWRTHPIN